MLGHISGLARVELKQPERLLPGSPSSGEQKKKKKKNLTSFGQPTKLITCANHGNDVACEN